MPKNIYNSVICILQAIILFEHIIHTRFRVPRV